jgi:AhpD family alkylhydroperoxidase
MPETRTHMTYQTLAKTAAASHAALLALGKSVDDSGLEKPLTELVKLRASQINGCAFCLQFHLDRARALGISAEKLDLAAGWREAGVFSAREMAALAWTETLTRMTADAGTDEAYAALRRHFTETEALFLTIAVGTINLWNRVGVGLQLPPSFARPASASAA